MYFKLNLLFILIFCLNINSKSQNFIAQDVICKTHLVTNQNLLKFVSDSNSRVLLTFDLKNTTYSLGKINGEITIRDLRNSVIIYNNNCITSPVFSNLPTFLENAIIATNTSTATGISSVNVTNLSGVLDSIKNKLYSPTFDTALDKHILLDSTHVRIINDSIKVYFTQPIKVINDTSNEANLKLINSNIINADTANRNALDRLLHKNNRDTTNASVLSESKDTLVSVSKKIDKLATETTLLDISNSMNDINSKIATQNTLDKIRINQLNGNQTTTLTDLFGNNIDGRTLPNASPLNVSVVDNNGNQITSFGVNGDSTTMSRKAITITNQYQVQASDSIKYRKVLSIDNLPTVQNVSLDSNTQRKAILVGNQYQVQASDSTKYRKVVSIDNNVTSNQTLTTAGFQKLTDGTNTATVKAGSTAPALADPALVVTISGNGTMFGALSPTSVPTRQIVTGGVFNTTLPTFTNGQSGALQVDATGRLITTQYNTSTITNTGATGIAVTATIPAPSSGLFNYITSIEITAYSTAARAGTATPIIVTTTNITGSPAYTFATVGAIGTTDRLLYSYNNPIKSTTAATATTIVCPAITNIIWRVNMTYFIAQ